MKKIIVLFFLTLSLCLVAAAQETQQKSKRGIGSGNPSEAKNEEKENVTPLKITFKPKSPYTDVAREKGIEGDIKIKVTFLANGEIGSVSPVTSMPFGLTEQALATAKKIKFEPQKVDGTPVTTVKVVVFNFVLVIGEDSEYVAQKAEIREMPNPEFPKDEKLKSLRGKVVIYALFQDDGTISVRHITTDLPKEFEQSAGEAVLKIKFKPAVDKEGKNISVIKMIEYDFKSQN